MTVFNKREPILLFCGDIIAFGMALWGTLFIRYSTIPSLTLLSDHILPFGILFIVWVLAFFIAGLYEKHTTILRNRLPSIILNTQLINTVLAIVFFYFIPAFGITPKTTLFIYLPISFALVLGWRLYGIHLFAAHHKQRALIVGSGEEMKELYEEVNHNDRYNLAFVSSIDLDHIEHFDFQKEVIERVYSEEISILVVDLRHKKVEPVLSHFYNLIFSKVIFIDMHKVYEDVFDRVPLSLLKDSWFIENISVSPKITYDILKRIMDIAVALPLFFLSLPLYPLVYCAHLFFGQGSVVFRQVRVGKNNQPIHITKFRTMTDEEDESLRKVTKLGIFLRRTRIDELPQLADVVSGRISLVGPRPEVPHLVRHYEEEISYYNVRHLIKPGLSGWAQIHQSVPPKFGKEVHATKIKLSYDIYYIKNRSFILDLKIALQTLKELLSRKGI